MPLEEFSGITTAFGRSNPVAARSVQLPAPRTVEASLTAVDNEAGPPVVNGVPREASAKSPTVTRVTATANAATTAIPGPARSRLGHVGSGDALPDPGALIEHAHGQAR